MQIAERRAGAGRRPNQRAAAAIAGTATAGCGLRRGSQTPPADPGLEAVARSRRRSCDSMATARMRVCEITPLKIAFTEHGEI